MHDRIVTKGRAAKAGADPIIPSEWDDPRNPGAAGYLAALAPAFVRMAEGNTSIRLALHCVALAESEDRAGNTSAAAWFLLMASTHLKDAALNPDAPTAGAVMRAAAERVAADVQRARAKQASA